MQCQDHSIKRQAGICFKHTAGATERNIRLYANFDPSPAGPRYVLPLQTVRRSQVVLAPFWKESRLKGYNLLPAEANPFTKRPEPSEKGSSVKRKNLPPVE